MVSVASPMDQFEVDTGTVEHLDVHDSSVGKHGVSLAWKVYMVMWISVRRLATPCIMASYSPSDGDTTMPSVKSPSAVRALLRLFFAAWLKE